jgi:hypothetical protein
MGNVLVPMAIVALLKVMNTLVDLVVVTQWPILKGLGYLAAFSTPKIVA